MLTEKQVSAVRETSRGLIRFMSKQYEQQPRAQNPVLVLFEGVLLLIAYTDGEVGTILREEREKLQIEINGAKR
jgi:hypothetical protein